MPALTPHKSTYCLEIGDRCFSHLFPLFSSSPERQGFEGVPSALNPQILTFPQDLLTTPGNAAAGIG